MRTALFLGTTQSKIDTKCRVSIPAAFRALLEDKNVDLILYPSFQYPCIEGCGGDILANMADKIDNEMPMFSTQKSDLESLIFGSSKAFVIDATGRIVLANDLIEQAKLTTEAVFIGCGKTFQIWNPELWQIELEKRRKQIKSKKGDSNG